MSAEGQSSVVSLVQQLKAGSITKEELFLKLSSLQKSKKPAADASPQPTSPSAPRPSRVVAAAPIKADISTNQTTSASAGATNGARFSGQDDVKQSQKSPVFSRGGGPALVDPSSEKYTLMPESLRRKSLHLLHLCMLPVLIAVISCSRGVGETPNICPSLSSYS